MSAKKAQQAGKGKLSPELFAGILVALFFAVALFVRIFYPYARVFTPEGIRFTCNDAYYHMRIVDNLAHNFPHLFKFDPYFIYPSGKAVGGSLFFDYLLAGIIWAISLGSPTQHTVDVISVYFPVVLCALTVIPVYFIGKELSSRWIGVLSAGLLSILGGEFVGRSILGSTDHHVAETLLSTTTIMFLILAIRTAGQKQLTFSHLRHLNWAIVRKPLIYSLLAGIFLGIYILTWMGALLFVFIISVFFVIQFIIDHLRGKSTDYLCLVGAALFLVTIILSLATSVDILYLVIALFIPLVLNVVSRLMTGKQIRPAYYPLVLLVLGGAGLGLFYLVDAPRVSSILSAFGIFHPTGAQLTTLEMQPLISSIYGNPLAVAWGNFTTGFFLSFISLGILIYLVIKQGAAEKTLLLVWSLVILAATLGQRRFGYYYSVNAALLTGYLSWRVLELAGFKELTPRAVKVAKQAGGGKARPKRGGLTTIINYTVMALAVLVVFFVVFFWNIGPMTTVARQAQYTPSDAWVRSLTWMKENTPEPFGNPDLYYGLPEQPPPGENYKYPESAYGVLAWWDYGYWITRIARRIPIANPSQEPKALTLVASYFVSQDEKSADEIAKKLGAKYIITDFETAYTNPITASGKFWAVATWAGRQPSEYFDFYLIPQENKTWVLRPLFYPEYYRSLIARLYNFDGKAVAPESVWVISYEQNVDKDGNIYKVITSAEQKSTYEEAEAYLSSQNSTNYRIVSPNPMLSPVPLEALEHYKLIYGSDNITLPDGRQVPEIKIFEYID